MFVLAAALAMIPMAAQADDGGSRSEDTAIERALVRIESGSWKQADLDLIRSNPELAAVLVDPSVVEDPIIESGDLDETATFATFSLAEPSVVAAVATSCKWVGVAYKQTTFLGDTAYWWHHRVEWCYDGSKVTTWVTRYDYTTNKLSTYYIRDLVVNQQGGVGTSSAWSHMSRAIENCVAKYGCIGEYTPWSKITVSKTGGYSYVGGLS